MKSLLLALAVAVAVVGCSKKVEPQPVAVAPPAVVAPAPVAVAPVSPVGPAGVPPVAVVPVAPVVVAPAPVAKADTDPRFYTKATKVVPVQKGEVTKPAKVAKKVCKTAVVTSTRYPDVSFAYDCKMGKGGANQALAVKILAKADANLKTKK